MSDKKDEFESFYLTETAALEIELPNGEPMIFNGKQVIVHIYGPSSSQYTKAKAALDKEASKRVIAALGQKSKNKEKEDQDADAKFLIAVTESIENFPFPGGVEAIYREPKLKYVHDQVREYLNDLGNFFTSGKTT
jgi:hypothetical protein